MAGIIQLRPHQRWAYNPDEVDDPIDEPNPNFDAQALTNLNLGADPSSTCVFWNGEDSMGGCSSGMGNDDQVYFPVPTLIPTSLQINFRTIVCGSASNAAIDFSGRLWTWGISDDEILGRAHEGDAAVPEFTPGLVEIPGQIQNGTVVNQVCQVSVGDMHMCVLMQDGSVFTWGTFKSDNMRMHHLDGSGAVVTHAKRPREMKPFSKKLIVQICSGINHVAALDSGGNIWIWGWSKLGNAIRTSSRGIARRYLTPTKLVSHPWTPFQWISSKYHNIFAIDRRGRLFAFGLNLYGLLGVPTLDLEESSSFRRVAIPAGAGRVRECHGGEHHVAAITEQGVIYTWGRNASGTLGRVTPLQAAAAPGVRPEAQPDPQPRVIATGCKSLAVGHGHVVFETQDGSIYGYGVASENRIGYGLEHEVRAGTARPVLLGSWLQAAGLEVAQMTAGSQQQMIMLKRIGVEMAKPPPIVKPVVKPARSPRKRRKPKSSKTPRKARKTDRKSTKSKTSRRKTAKKSKRARSPGLRGKAQRGSSAGVSGRTK